MESDTSHWRQGCLTYIKYLYWSTTRKSWLWWLICIIQRGSPMYRIYFWRVSFFLENKKIDIDIKIELSWFYYSLTQQAGHSWKLPFSRYFLKASLIFLIFSFAAFSRSFLFADMALMYLSDRREKLYLATPLFGLLTISPNRNNPVFSSYVFIFNKMIIIMSYPNSYILFGIFRRFALYLHIFIQL